MSFGDWVDIFTFKSEKYKNDKLKYELANLKSKDKEEMYFTKFIFYLFNYQSYIDLKK